MRSGSLGETPSLPFQGVISLTRHCSYQGAKTTEPRAGSQAFKVLLAIKEYGPLSDHDLHDRLAPLPMGTINARRHWLWEKGLIQPAGSKPGPFKTPNTLWRIADAVSR